jgi:DNA-binding NarL/FixJ family response regulator
LAQADVAILDIKLKHGSGIEVCRALKERQPRIGVILLSAFWDDHLVAQALDARADGYLLKDTNRFDLGKTIATVASGRSFFDPAVSGTIARYARGETATARFSSNDLQILRLASEGMTNRAIGVALSLSPHTVRDRLSRLLVVLGAKNRAEAAQIAMRRGLI